MNNDKDCTMQGSYVLGKDTKDHEALSRQGVMVI